MKMPSGPIDPNLFAPCGMNCLVCYRHCFHKKPCDGCLNSDQGKPEHCRKCSIKSCTREKGVQFCWECGEHPCKQIKSLDKSYRVRYGASLIHNSQLVKEKGLAVFLKEQKEIFTCPHCGGVISLHDAQCSECKQGIGDALTDSEKSE